jgi:hypothetical protein
MNYRQIYDNLYAYSLTPEQHERTCDYWFNVTNGAMAHTAFHTRAALDRWLTERNLTLENELPEPGTSGSARIIGEYHTESHGVRLHQPGEEWVGMGPGDFYNLRPIAAMPTLSNGEYTLALVTEEDGVRVINTLNPNVRSRVVFDYRRTAELLR